MFIASAAIRSAAPPGADAPIVSRRDAASASLLDLALESGARTAMLSQCGIDSGSIKFAFEHQLEASGMSQTARRDLWQSYGTAQTAAAAVLARSGSMECGGAHDLLKNTIHDLDRPASQLDPADPTESAERDLQ